MSRQTGIFVPRVQPGSVKERRKSEEGRWSITMRVFGSSQGQTLLISIPFEAKDCQICARKGARPAKYQSVKAAQEHAATVHWAMPLRFVCGGCCKIFGSQHAVTCHLRCCQGPPPSLEFACVECLKSFKTARGLKQHTIRSHDPPAGVPVHKGSRITTWTDEEEKTLLKLEYNNRDYPDTTRLLAAALKHKNVAQIRARRALKSHQVKARQYAIEKERGRTAGAGTAGVGLWPAQGGHPLPGRFGSSLRCVRRQSRPVSRQPRVPRCEPAGKAAGSLPTQRNYVSGAGGWQVFHDTGSHTASGLGAARGGRGLAPSGPWRVSARVPGESASKASRANTEGRPSAEGARADLRVSPDLQSDVPQGELAPRGPSVRKEESVRKPVKRPLVEEENAELDGASIPKVTKPRPVPLGYVRAAARNKGRNGRLPKGLAKGGVQPQRKGPVGISGTTSTPETPEPPQNLPLATAAVPPPTVPVSDTNRGRDNSPRNAGPAAGVPPNSLPPLQEEPPEEWAELYVAEFRDWQVPPDLENAGIEDIFTCKEPIWNQATVDSTHHRLVDWLLQRGTTPAHNTKEVRHTKKYRKKRRHKARQESRAKREQKGRHRQRSHHTRVSKKRHDFARAQELMDHDPGSLTRHICNGTDFMAPNAVTAPREEVERLYTELWATRVPTEELPTPKTPSTQLRAERFLKPFSGMEVLKRVRRLDNHTAAGPDGIQKDHLNDPARAALITFLYNRALSSRTLPSAWLENRTTLIPKEGKDTSVAANCRPITIGSLLGRVFWGLVSDRLGKAIHLSPRQKGFVKEAGCFNNVHTLSELLYLMKTKEGGTAVQLDVKKAFDTAPHDAIAKALANKGVPRFFCTLVARSYEGVHTSIAHQEGNIAVQLLRGVKQGDPLSPLLFNLILEPLLLRLERMAGFALGNIRVSVLAFADDLFLLATNPKGAQALLNVTEAYLRKLGMSLAPEKSLAINIQRHNGAWKFTDPKLTLNGVPLQAAVKETRFRYLGGYLGPDGEVDVDQTVRDIETVLRRLTTLRLTSTNKFTLLSKHLVPHFLHQLTLALPKESRLKEIDAMIRTVLRKILHLPQWTNQWILYTSIRNGGLGFPNLCNMVTMVGLRLGRKFRLSDDPLLRSIWPGSQLKKKLDSWRKSAGLSAGYTTVDLGKLRTSREEAMLDKWADQESQGGAVHAFRGGNLGNLFLQQPTLLRPCRFITAVQMRANVAVTRTTLVRTGARTSDKCRRCGNRKETLGHIIGYCSYTKPARIKRHDDIKEFIAGRLRTQVEVQSVEVERRFIHEAVGERTPLQPDITVRRGESGFLLDVTVRVESPGYVQKAINQKKGKYECLLPVLEAEMGTTTTEVLPLVVGTRGAMPPETVSNLCKLGITARRDLNTIVLIALRSTLEIYHAFKD
jgi:Reverse transcriptase (RNA-dependent DNA polymerase)